MDLIRLLKSLEELIYELVSWLVFYPLTMWHSIAHPQAMMRYAESELLDKDQDQFTDTMSPPIFLTVTLLLTSLINTALVRPAPSKLPSIVASDTNLLIFRAILFSVMPLLMAAKVLRSHQIPLDRKPLQPQFYSQCFVAAPFSFVTEMSITFSQMHSRGHARISVGLVLAALTWYLLVETRWFSDQLKISRLRAFWTALGLVAEGTAIVLALLIAVGLGLRGQ